MAQHLTINGKKYLPSCELADTFGYTSDYLGKLAREEKILGTLINRQWFIEASSLEVHLHKVKIEKELLKQELSSKRKLERSSHEVKALVRHNSPVSPVVAFAQSVAIVLCGLLLGTVGFAANTHNVGLDQLVTSSHDTASFILAAISPAQALRNLPLDSRSSSASSAEGVLLYSDPNPISTDLRFTVLPLLGIQNEFIAVASSSTSTATFTQDSAELSFSDEVQITLDEVGNTLIQPLFKTATSSVKAFILMPVNAQEN